MPVRPNPESQRIVDRFPPDQQSKVLTPMEDDLINRRYRASPPEALPAIAAEYGIPRTTMGKHEMRALTKMLRFNLRRGH